VGIVASRLKEATGRPAVVIGLRGDGTGQGSGRSIGTVDLGASVQRLVGEGLLLKGGGHRMAAGLTVEASCLEAAMERLDALLARQGAAAGEARDLAIDGVLMPGAATLQLIDAIEAAGPFGQGASAPRFAFPDLRVAHARPVGDGHLKIALTDGSRSRLDAIAFRAATSGLSQAVDRAAGAPIHVAGRLERNRWQGREDVQLQVEDIALPDDGAPTA
jgi:single-stranded-DNA-specific exonuclease